MTMVIGEFRHNITVERLTISKDAYGATNSIYTLHLTLKAGVKYLAGSKSIDNYEIFSSQSLQFTTYYRDIVSTDRIIFAGKYYRILNISPIGFNEGLIINAELIND